MTHPQDTDTDQSQAVAPPDPTLPHTMRLPSGREVTLRPPTWRDYEQAAMRSTATRPIDTCLLQHLVTHVDGAKVAWSDVASVEQWGRWFRSRDTMVMLAVVRRVWFVTDVLAAAAERTVSHVLGDGEGVLQCEVEGAAVVLRDLTIDMLLSLGGAADVVGAIRGLVVSIDGKPAGTQWPLSFAGSQALALVVQRHLTASEDDVASTVGSMVAAR